MRREKEVSLGHVGMKFWWRHSERAESKDLLSAEHQSHSMMLGQPALPLWLESHRNPLGKDLGRWRNGGLSPGPSCIPISRLCREEQWQPPGDDEWLKDLYFSG